MRVCAFARAARFIKSERPLALQSAREEREAAARWRTQAGRQARTRLDTHSTPTRLMDGWAPALLALAALLALLGAAALARRLLARALHADDEKSSERKGDKLLPVCGKAVVITGDASNTRSLAPRNFGRLLSDSRTRRRSEKEKEGFPLGGVECATIACACARVFWSPQLCVWVGVSVARLLHSNGFDSLSPCDLEPSDVICTRARAKR